MIFLMEKVKTAKDILDKKAPTIGTTTILVAHLLFLLYYNF